MASKTDTFKFDAPEVKKQRDRSFASDNGSAKPTIMGKSKGPIIPATRTVKAQPVLKYGKKVKLS